MKGITDNSIFTLGKIKLYFLKFAIEFHTVNNYFPIKEGGLLGSDFFSQLRAKIDYETKQLIISDLSVPFYEENEEVLVNSIKHINYAQKVDQKNVTKEMLWENAIRKNRSENIIQGIAEEPKETLSQNNKETIFPLINPSVKHQTSTQVKSSNLIKISAVANNSEQINLRINDIIRCHFNRNNIKPGETNIEIDEVIIKSSGQSAF